MICIGRSPLCYGIAVVAAAEKGGTRRGPVIVSRHERREPRRHREARGRPKNQKKEADRMNRIFQD
jgi:hypothetical protein